jgi:hypothetical protein
MADTLTQGCVHHWVLATPEDEVVRGRCKRCGLTREYPASLDGTARKGAYEEAAALTKTVTLLPDLGSRGDLPGRQETW